MGCGMTFVDDKLHQGFYRLGLVVARHPGYFLIIPVLLTALFATGYQQIKYQMDPEYLFSPIRGEGKTERAVVEKYFKPNYTSRFNVGRITRPGRFGRVIVVPRHGHNMLTAEIFEELRLLDSIIQNTTAYWDEEVFTYSDVCARWIDQCFQNDILNLDYVIDQVEAGTLNLTFPIMFNPVTWDMHAFPVYFGGTVVGEDGIIQSVPAIQLVYFVTADTRRQDSRGAAWEEAFLSAVGDAEARLFRHISTARFASRTLDIELERNTRTVVPFFGVTFAMLAIFSVVSCTMVDWVRSKPWLGLLGNLSAVMGTVAAFGLAMYLGIEFIGINLAAPFLMLGIGIDDTFVMLAAWRRTSSRASVPERMAIMMSEAAVSITITSLTDILSFFIGIISPFQSVRIFCMYSGLAVTFTFLWHITFFTACVALAGYAEQGNRHSIICIRATPVSLAENRSWLYRMFCTGGINLDAPEDPRDNKEHCLMAFFRDKVANILCKWPVKCLVIVIFAFYLAGAFYGVTRIKEGLERRKLSRADSYSVEFYDREDLYYREFPYRIQVIISGELNYSDPVVQDQVEELTQAFENTSYISSPLYTESWLRSWVGYIRRNEDLMNGTLRTEAGFLQALKEMWLFTPNPFSLDVRFNEDESRIIASRFLIQAVNITDTNHEKEMVNALREICRASPLNVSVFHPYFVFFDQFELVRPTTLQSMIIGAIIMMLVCFVFIPNMLCSVWVAFSIVSIEMGVIGYMALWNVNLDSISMINLIMCIGFSVDFTAHICYAYMSSKAPTSSLRVSESLYALGLPIVQGAFSTILAVVSLVLADSYIFLVFFKMVFLVVFFGAMHGLFLLPVLLSLLGPGKCDKSPKSETTESGMTTPQEPTPPLKDSPRYTHNNNEKDLGLGTSGEDSSESSSGRSQRRYQPGWARPCEFQPPHLVRAYTNGGFVPERDDSRIWASMAPSYRAKYQYSPPRHHPVHRYSTPHYSPSYRH